MSGPVGNLEPVWSTAIPDWKERLREGRSLIPFEPLYPEEAEAALETFKSLRVVDVAGKPTFGEIGEEWLFDFVRAIFGAYDAENGKRKIREALLLVAKKNGKSTLAAGIMLTALIRNWRVAGEYIILAPTLEIADNSFKPAADMVREDPELTALLHIQPTFRLITHRTTRATLKVIAADTDVVGGKKAIGVLIDELWIFGKRADANRMLMEATGGQTSRPEGFVIYTSTHSDEPPAGVFKEKLKQFRDVRDGKVVDNRKLPVLYEFPEEMIASGEYLEPQNWRITNPNLGKSADPEYMADELRTVLAGPKENLAIWLAKFLNVEIGQTLRSDRWSGADFWQAAGRKFTLEDMFRVCEVIVAGIDGGGLDDLLALALLGRNRETKQWMAWVHAWAHEIVLEKRKGEATVLQGFVQNGDLSIIGKPGKDVDELVAYVVRCEELGLLPEKVAIGIDQLGIGQIVEALSAAGIGMERIGGISQGFKLNAAIESSARKVADGTLIHAAQPIMAWAVGNVKVEQRGSAVIATKQAAGRAKIDPFMALMDAFALMTMNPEAQGLSVWDQIAGLAASGDKEVPEDGIDRDILRDPMHPRWREMRDRYEDLYTTEEDD